MRSVDRSVKTERLLSLATIVVIGTYLLFRVVVSRCEGAACDAYIPISLLLPLLILVMVAITGVSGAVAAKAHRRWFGTLVVVTLLGVLGPPASLVIFRDQPDILVPLAIILELLVPITVLWFSSRT